MSLTSILKSSHPKCKEVKEIIKSISPRKSDFKTYSGIPSFINYQSISEIQLLNSYDSSVVGTVFDFLAKIVCAYYTDTALSAKEFEKPKINMFLAETKNKSLLTLYKDIQNQIDSLLANKEKTLEINDIFISGIIFMAKLENLWRSGFLPVAQKTDLVKSMNKMVYDDINFLINGFNHAFIKTDLIKTDSLITYNPRFSANINIALGGIDADICIDNTLYDFKSTKNHGFMIKDSLQITSYYIFYLMDKIMRSTVNMQRHQIDRIALYKARFGQVEYFDVKNIPKDDIKYVISELNKIFKLGMPDQRIKDF
jgi:hypothetical protein